MAPNLGWGWIRGAGLKAAVSDGCCVATGVTASISTDVKQKWGEIKDSNMRTQEGIKWVEEGGAEGAEVVIFQEVRKVQVESLMERFTVTIKVEKVERTYTEFRVTFT